ncbi:MAG: hypothetical protein WC054_15255 [Candidatus Nanopelagicales bacterium]
MADAALEDFLSRVNEHLPGLSRDKFSNDSWRYQDRPTSEGLGLKPGVSVDPEKVVACILDVEAYKENVKYVEEVTVSERGDNYVIYTQKVKLPVLGGLQFTIKLEDLGEINGYRVVGWNQDDALTDALDKKHGGARTEYNLGAWLVKPDEVAYALSAVPLKKDVGSLKYAVMTKGADATASSVLSDNIDAMIEWANRT